MAVTVLWCGQGRAARAPAMAVTEVRYETESGSAKYGLGRLVWCGTGEDGPGTYANIRASSSAKHTYPDYHHLPNVRSRTVTICQTCTRTIIICQTHVHGPSSPAKRRTRTIITCQGHPCCNRRSPAEKLKPGRSHPDTKNDHSMQKQLFPGPLAPHRGRIWCSGGKSGVEILGEGVQAQLHVVGGRLSMGWSIPPLAAEYTLRKLRILLEAGGAGGAAVVRKIREIGGKHRLRATEKTCANCGGNT
eukprot:gene16399-biopygen6761